MSKKKEGKTFMEFMHAALPVAIALVVFLVSAGFIIFKIVNDRNYNERWKDYDECGLS